MREGRPNNLQLNNSATSQTTQPVAQRNTRRTQQISSLHIQFQQIKKKIKDVEIKNQKIIKKIHQQYDFKKKPQTMQYVGVSEPVVYYEQPPHNMPQLITLNSHQSTHSASNKSKQKNIQNNIFHHSTQYQRNINNQRQPSQSSHTTNPSHLMTTPYQSNDIYNYSPVPNNRFKRKQPYQINPFGYGSAMQIGSRQIVNDQFQQSLRRQKQKVKILQEQLEARQADAVLLRRLQKKMNNMSLSYEQVIENKMQEFMQEVVKAGFYQIQKNLKRNENKLRRLQLGLRDKCQEYRSCKNIQEHNRLRKSRTKKDSPVRPSTSSSKRSNKPPNPTKTNDPSSRSKASDNSRSSQQFELIASQYEQMIKSKNYELEIAQKKIRSKDTLIQQLQVKLNKIQKNDNPKQINSIQLISSNNITQNKQQLQKLSKLIQQKNKQITRNKIQFHKKLKQWIEKNKHLQTQISRLKQTNNKLQKKLIRSQQSIKFKQNQINNIKQQLIKSQNYRANAQCQTLGLNNKIKKLQTLLNSRDEKIHQLQTMIQGSDSIDLDKSILLSGDQTQLLKIQQQKQNLQQQINQIKQQYIIIQSKNKQLVNQNKQLKINIQDLQMQYDSLKINIKAMSFEKYSQSDNDNEDNQQLRNQIQELRNKCQELQRQLKVQKHQGLQQSTKTIKLASDLSYHQDLLADRDSRIQKLRKQLEQQKIQLTFYQQTINQKQQQLQHQKKINQAKIRQLEQQQLQFQQQVYLRQSGDSKQSQQLRNSRAFSQQNWVNQRTSLSAQKTQLQQKLKQAQKMLQVQKQTQIKMQNEYKSNIDKLRTQLKQKNKQIQTLIQKSKKCQLLQTQLIQVDKGTQSQDRIRRLQFQLAQARQINQKLTQIQSQLFKQLTQKQNQLQQMLRQINIKDRRIDQLQDIIQLKDINYSSHISNSQIKGKIGKQLMQSQSSLRYSAASGIHGNRTIQLQLSQAGQSFFDQNQSILSNVSEVFGKQQFPYQKMQLKRTQQRRLFQKTSAYIKSLKKAIQQKNKRIKTLQKKIQSLRSSQLVRKQILDSDNNINIQKQHDNGQFKDYLSVQMGPSTASLRRLKQLQHQTALTIQQNNLLHHQVESLQDELNKAQQQENSLMKLKDLYKEQIKTLIKKNQQQLKNYQDQIQRQNQKLQDSQSIQRMDAIKQLIVKMLTSLPSLVNDTTKSKKRDQKKRQLEDYVKILTNFLDVQNQTRQKLMNQFKK